MPAKPIFGADGGGRTHTASRLLDFESSASANSATSATINYQPLTTTLFSLKFALYPVFVSRNFGP